MTPEYHQHVAPGGYGVQGPGARLTIHHTGPRYHLCRFEPVPPTPVERLRHWLDQPGSLLREHRQVVPFTARGELIRELDGWRDQPDAPAALLLHAAGGQGKTRLARHACTRWREAGWAAVWAHHATDPPAAETAGPPAPDRPMLLVVDYAERWPAVDLTRLLHDQLAPRRAPTRVLLLARSIEWWPRIAAELDKLDMRGHVRPLPPLAISDGERARLLAQARDRYAEIYRYPDPSAVALPTMTGADAGQVLSIHMAALAAVDAASRAARPPGHLADVTAYLLLREREYWAKLYGDERVTAIARTTFVAALTGQLANAIAASTVDSTGLPAATGLPAQQLLDAHRRCYPGLDGNALEPLYPDRLAEDFIALNLPGHDEGYPADPWCGELLVAAGDPARPGRLFARGTGNGLAPYTGRALTFLAASAARWPQAGRYLAQLLSADPAIAMDAGGAALAAVAAAADPALLVRLAEQLPERPHADLDAAAALLTERATRYLLAGETDDAKRAQLKHDLSWRYAQAGQAAAALGPARESVTLYRTLAADDAAYRGKLANALDNLGNRLDDIGEYAEAARVTEQAVGHLEALATADPAAVPTLATCLDNLANRLKHLGQDDQALRLNGQAVELLRTVSRAAPALRPHHLAIALNNRAALLLKLAQRHAGSATRKGQAKAGNRREGEGEQGGHTAGFVELLAEARAAAEEARDRYRALAAADGDTYLPGLARSLANLATAISGDGDHAGAARLLRGAVDAFQTLVARNPAYVPDLVGGLFNLGWTQIQAGQRREALNTLREALGTLTAHPVPANREVYAQQLTLILRTLAAVASPDLDEIMPDIQALVTALHTASRATEGADTDDRHWLAPPPVRDLLRKLASESLFTSIDRLADQFGTDLETARWTVAQYADARQWAAWRTAPGGQALPLTGDMLLALQPHDRFWLGLAMPTPGHTAK
ncbi:P-loop NTPase [Rugosimonospora africana]|uniref:Novel STAND NTPase 5 domain-containing protein n=1 Tax=Rugosimonospora africana TaxID=556532 RepID=A0A8J3VVR6_9ACTN|nr:tetratricopeptide repeat protein [Rugosimonospora africana]GIH20051.1 hypothetical protein Raf01_82230 [Rugosimonospora africana]